MSEDAQDVVLIVEDDESIMFVLGEYLAGLGYRVLKAINGEQAFEILATKPHLDLMVTDYRLPGGISGCLLYTSPSPRDRTRSRMPSSA